MSQLTKLSADLVEEVVRDEGYAFDKDDDGDIMFQLVRHGFADEVGADRNVLIVVRTTFLQVSVLAINIAVPRKDWGSVLAKCNQWNIETVSGSAILFAQDYKNDETAVVGCRTCVRLEETTKDQVRSILSMAIATANSLFQNLREDKAI
jgi:hypothetical protein